MGPTQQALRGTLTHVKVRKPLGSSTGSSELWAVARKSCRAGESRAGAVVSSDAPFYRKTPKDFQHVGDMI